MEVLLVEDNPADVALADRALKRSQTPVRLHAVRDGEDAIAFLQRAGSFADCPVPDLVLLDLGLPGKGGTEVLVFAKEDPQLRRIPVIILTSSSSDEDVLRCYDLGANSYLSKPHDLDGLEAMVEALERFWLEHARLPRA